MTTLGDQLRSRIASATSSELVAPGRDGSNTPPSKATNVPRGVEFSFTVEASSPVGMSADLERILALPRRNPEPPEGLAEQMTAELKRPNGTMNLWAIQAFALSDIRLYGGLVGAIGVGWGKGLISLLAPTVLNSRVTVLLVPPALKDQTITKFYPAYAPHFRLPNLHGHSLYYPDSPGVIHVVSYSQLSSARGADILDALRPDTLVLDEAHAVAHTTAARTKRFRRYVNQARSSGHLKHVVALSGTLLAKRIEDTAGLSKLVLRKGSPFPLDYHTLESWGEALNPSADGDSRDPGELVRLCRAGEDARSGFRRRLIETPGVVATSESSVSTSLVFNKRSVVVPEVVVKALAELSLTWCTPGGEELVDALSFWRAARQIAAGLYLRWTWPRQEPLELRQEWLAARKEWHRELRDFLTHRAAPGMDSPLLLARAAAAGKWASMSYADWARIHKACKPKTEVVWVDRFMVEDAVEWGAKTPGIIWCEIDGLAREIAKTGGFPHYGAESESPGDILAERGNRTIVASVASRGTGLNLQMWHRNLFTSPMSNAKAWEQAVARTHRPGQSADQVDVWLYTHGPLGDAFRSAIAEARFVSETLGAKQRLLYGSYTFTP